MIVEPFAGIQGTPLVMLIFVPLGSVVGGLAGLVCAIICVPLLREKDLTLAAKKLLTFVSPIVVVMTIVLSPTPLPFALCPLVFVVACVVLNRTLPNAYDYDCCQECGYNLTGNVSGVCPECGTGVKKP
jgi:hypothetical protein